MAKTLTITEIYASIQGESSHAGWPCTFVRLTGCPLRCRWCDTAYAFAGGKEMTLDAIVEEVVKLGVPMVELTGGEPLAQAAAPALAALLQAKGLQVLIETSGSEDVSALPQATHIIMDIKCPGSNMQERNKLGNLQHLKPTDDVKFVLADRADFDWAMELISKEHLDSRFNVLLSCAFGLLKPMDLAAWMLERPALKARLQLQQHKYIWHPRAKGV